METAKVKKKISGIYCIENKINKRKYIGKSVNIRKRFYEHKRNLLNNKHTNKFLQRDFNKSGINNFVFYIISEFKESELEEKFNRSCIFRCLRGSQKTHSGCIWVRKEDYNNDSIF